MRASISSAISLRPIALSRSAATTATSIPSPVGVGCGAAASYGFSDMLTSACLILGFLEIHLLFLERCTPRFPRFNLWPHLLHHLLKGDRIEIPAVHTHVERKQVGQYPILPALQLAVGVSVQVPDTLVGPVPRQVGVMAQHDLVLGLIG